MKKEEKSFYNNFFTRVRCTHTYFHKNFSISWKYWQKLLNKLFKHCHIVNLMLHHPPLNHIIFFQGEDNISFFFSHSRLIHCVLLHFDRAHIYSLGKYVKYFSSLRQCVYNLHIFFFLYTHKYLIDSRHNVLRNTFLFCFQTTSWRK